MIGEYEQALRYAEQSLSILSQNVRAQQRLVAALGYLGRIEKSKSALEKLITLQPGFSLDYLETTYAYKDPERLRYFIDGLKSAGWTP